jgi:PTS system mannose-specific IIB component/fructoselysine and glucoselysine-specific PTS system IIB component
MSIALLRVDERLIHGQVVVGWGSQLHPDRIIVVDDDLAASEWEQELYTLGLSGGLGSEFVSVRAARERFAEWKSSSERIIVLLRDVATLQQFAADGFLAGEPVNIGGIHHAAGRRPVLPYLYLNDDESAQLAALHKAGVRISAQDVPGGRRVESTEFMAIERRS